MSHLDETEKSNVLMTGKGVSDSNIKNIDGHLGERCKVCSGLGYVNALGGKGGSCVRCDGCGIEPISPYELQKQIDEIKETLVKMGYHLKLIPKFKNKTS